MSDDYRRGMPRPLASVADFVRDDGVDYATVEDELRQLAPEEQAAQVFRLWLLPE